jgi:hypothetical protein
MQRTRALNFRSLFDPHFGLRNRLLPRWLFLRGLALIYFAAFYSLLFQIRGLIGPQGVEPAIQYLALVRGSLGSSRFWFAPTFLWVSSSNRALMILCWLGIIASIAALVDAWPRLSFPVCFVCYLSFVAAAGDFSGYQSDGMLLEAGFLALFLCPSGWRPGLGELTPPSRAAYFLLQWEWFRIYFESGAVKLLSGDQEWRHFTAMDDYYSNGPLPTWVGWYIQHLPHWFHAATVVATLGLELVLVLMLFLPRRWRLICFFIVTPWEIGVILTANYTFLNYLVLLLGILLLDDRLLRRLIPERLRRAHDPDGEDAGLDLLREPAVLSITNLASHTNAVASAPIRPRPKDSHLRAIGIAVPAVSLTLIAYVTTAQMIRMFVPELPLPAAPIHMLDPFRIANRYGLFAVMTRGRYEIEFQGSNDGQTWSPYPFRYKPQALNERPGIYAPYQPRFDWNLWFASLGDWQQNTLVPLTEERLLANDSDVLGLFRWNPFLAAPPKYVRAVLWQYWFTSMEQKRQTGDWWRRQRLGLYAPVLANGPDGKPAVVEWPPPLPPHN